MDLDIYLETILASVNRTTCYDLLSRIWQFCRDRPSEKEAVLRYLLAHSDELARRVARTLQHEIKNSLYCKHCGIITTCLLIDDPEGYDLEVLYPLQDIPYFGRGRLCMSCGNPFVSVEVDRSLIENYLRMQASLEKLGEIVDNAERANAHLPTGEIANLLQPLKVVRLQKERVRAHSVFLCALGLSNRLVNVLQMEEIETIDQVCRYRAEELLAFRHMTEACLAELRALLASRGLKLTGE